jgi:hypothetical protein
MVKDSESWTDEQTGNYSPDKKLLMCAPNVKRYRIKEGCERVDEKAFVDCDQLQSLYVPYTFTDVAFKALMNSDATGNEIGHICHWDRPYIEEVYDTNDYWYDEADTFIDEYGVMYANEGRRLISATKPDLIGKDYMVPDGVVTICDGAFGGCQEYLELSVPRSIKVIGDYIFGEESGRIVIRD